MPLLKVSNKVKKYALEVIRVPLGILGDCPRCQSSGYRDGMCPDCKYIDPATLQTIAEWQKSQKIQEKAAFRSLSFADMLPDFPSISVKCPRCKKNTFQVPEPKGRTNKKDLYKQGGECTNPECKHEIAGPLGFKRPDKLGIDDRWLKDRGGIQHNFLSRAAQKIEDNKNRLTKSAKDQTDLGALQDDSMNAKDDATTRMRDMLLNGAEIDAEQKHAEKSEEL